jgi:hypothetical protein
MATQPHYHPPTVTHPVGAYPESIVVDCKDIHQECIDTLYQHGLFVHCEGNGKDTCTHTLNELFAELAPNLYIWDFLTSEHIAGWCGFLRSVSGQNPQCKTIAFRFKTDSGKAFAFHYSAETDTVELV